MKQLDLRTLELMLRSKIAAPMLAVALFFGVIAAHAQTFTFSKRCTTSERAQATPSATQVTATVPTGAVTGKIGITTAGGTATSVAHRARDVEELFPDVNQLLLI